MNIFEFKNLVKTLKNSLKQRTFFKDLRKEVETGANGTQDYVVKKGVNKDTIATTRIFLRIKLQFNLNLQDRKKFAF